jgi:hypothetical protein
MASRLMRIATPASQSKTMSVSSRPVEGPAWLAGAFILDALDDSATVDER